MTTEIIKVPDIGGSDDVEVIEICVAVGDVVAAEDSLLVLESDKASMEVPSPKAGKVVAISVAVGDSIAEGGAILELEVEAGGADQESAATDAAAAAVVEPVVEPAAVAVVAAVAASAVEAVAIPDVGGAEDVDVIEICVAVGDSVSEGDSLIVLETDKASMEVPSPKAGKVVSLAIKEGDKASEGSVILELEVQAAIAPAAVAVAASPAAEAQTSAPTMAPPAPVLAAPVVAAAAAKTGSRLYAGPAVRKLAREFGVDVAKVSGSGPKGRLLKEDVQSYVKKALSNKKAEVSGGSGIPPIPAVDFAKFGEVSIEPLSKIAKLTAANMQRSWLNVPHVTQFDETDISDLEDFRKTLKAEAERRGTRITPLPFLLKACALALRTHPKFNSSLDETGENIVYKQYVHIGMAVDTPAGLVVPVIRDVDKKSIWELSIETAELAAKAKNRKLKPAEMQGGCFTISSLGGIGGTGFTPIVNAPEVAILGISKLAVKPVWDGKEFQPRKMLPLSLSYDHRVINGADAGRFFTFLGELLADIRRLAL